MGVARKFCHFYADIVKFGIILTHLKLFWGNWGNKKILGGGQMPLMSPCSAASVLRTLCHSNVFLTLFFDWSLELTVTIINMLPVW